MWMNVEQRLRAACVAATLLSGCAGDVGSSPPAGGIAPSESGSHESPTPPNQPPGLPGTPDPAGPTNPSSPGNPLAPSPTGTSTPGSLPTLSPSGYTPSVRGEPIHARLVRLTHPQWENSVRDLLQLDAPSGLSDSFEGDPPRGTFGNNERSLEVTSTLWGDYQRAAEALAEAAAADAARRTAILAGATNSEQFVREFGLKAYRRPLSDEQVQAYTGLYDSASSYFPDLEPEVAGFRLVVEAMLQSPHFIYRSEMNDVGGRLDSYEVASKLSFLLRSTTPDPELLEAASQDALGTVDSVRQWAQRMLDESGITGVIANYNTTLFGTHRFDWIVKDTELFPEFDVNKSSDLRQDTELFLAHIFENDLGLRELLTSTVGFVNSTTAPLYGVTAPSGESFTQVDLGPERPGLFTRVAFLAYNGTNTQPDPIHRGVDLNHRLLCVNLVAPPGELPQLPPFEPNQTNRERVAAFTEAEGTSCATCHGTVINPLGFAFENYDAIGRYRTTDNDRPVDASGTYQFATGLASFQDATELTELLAENPQVHACYTQHLAEFVLGRDLDQTDSGLVIQLMDQSLASASIKDLILNIVQSDAFLTRQEVTP